MNPEKMTTACEVQAVILVGFGTHLSILTDDHVHLSLLPEEQRLPKTLLPVANTPVLSLILKWLDSAKIDNILIICELNCRAKISEFLKINNTSRIDLVECNSEGVGSADALRLFRDKIRHDFLVISSDLVLTIPPRLLIDPFRSLQSALTAVYFESDGTESKNIRDEDLFDYVGIENSKSRLVYQVSCLDVDEKIELKAGLLKKFPVIDLHTNYKDVHLYLFKRWVIDFIFEKKKISSIKNDLVPLLLKCQYNKRICEREVLLNSCTIGTLSHISSSTGVPDGILTPIEESNSTPDSSVLNYRPSGGDENNTFQQWKQKVVCTAIVVSEKDGFCARVNTLGSYLDINLKFAKYVNVLKLKDDVEAKEKAQLLQQTLLQQSTQKSTNQAKKKKEKESPDTPKPDASKPPTHSKASSQSKIPSQPSAASIESPSMLQKNKSAAEVTGSLSKLKLSSAQDITQVNLTTPIPKVQIGADSLLGDGCKIGDRCSIKRSVIGSNCIIGKNVKVADSVIMDYVTIEDSAKIEGCILSRSVKIQEKSLLKECEVGGGQIVPHDTIGKNEQYSLEN